MRSLTVISTLASAGLAASTLVFAGAPAQAQGEGVGAGRAVIHIDSPVATVRKTGRHSYRIVLRSDASGQWMGERKDSRGRQVARVGDLTAKKLSRKWKKFRYTHSGAVTTLAWFEGGLPQSALVTLSQPTLVGNAVRFDFTSRVPIPTVLWNMSFNLRRAPEKHTTRGNEETVTIVDDLAVQATLDNISYIDTRVFNKSNDNTCWTGDGAKVITEGSTANVYVSVTTNTCDNITYQNQFPAANGNSAYGVWVAWIQGTTPGSMTYYLTINLNDGSDPYTWTDQLLAFPTQN